MSKNILIVDDSPIIRYALKAMIDEIGEYTLIDEATGGESAITLIKQHKPDLVLLDVHMPELDGEEVLKEVYNSNIKFLALSGVNDKSRIASLFNNGIDGFLSKEHLTAEELKNAIHTIFVEKEIYMSADIFADELADGLKVDDILSDFKDKKITKREKGILQLLVQGLSNIEIGEKLFISDRTVGKHRENIMRKAGCSNVAELIQYAKNAGFIA